MIAMTQPPLKIIAIETSAQIGSVALGENSQLIEETSFTEDKRHVAELLTHLDRLCRKHHFRPADIDRIYVSQGPGSYTGLRVGITAAKTLAFAHPIRLIPVPTSDILVLNLENDPHLDKNPDSTPIAIISDAGQDRIYVSIYRKTPNEAPSAKHPVPNRQKIAPSTVMTLDEFLEKSPRPLLILGEPLEFYREKLTAGGITHLPQSVWQPHARNVLRCGWLREKYRLFIQPDQLAPIYPRRPLPEEKREAQLSEKSTSPKPTP